MRSEKQLRFEQFFTPAPIANFMASLFDVSNKTDLKVLDPGAGTGLLGLSLVNRFESGSIIDLTFVEYEPDAVGELLALKSAANINKTVEPANFFDVGSEWLSANKKFTHIIINPPYAKLSASSDDANMLRQIGISAPNTYAAFVWLAGLLLEDDGELVAIIPRSFCNGPYFKKFREYISQSLCIEGVHVFGSRKDAFGQDNVLQENVIVHLSKRHQKKDIRISHSIGQDLSALDTYLASAETVFIPGDNELVIHLPLDNKLSSGEMYTAKISELMCSVSTGSVVDFRSRSQITEQPVTGSIPLIYPVHMNGFDIRWPSTKIKKGQHYLPVSPRDRNVFPLDGYYVVVRRFSSKEERRRVFAAVLTPTKIHSYVAFENHVNIFHNARHGLDRDLAYGLAAYLNSEYLDRRFRIFSGHTQVNVGDLKAINYPGYGELKKIGNTVCNASEINDVFINSLIGSYE